MNENAENHAQNCSCYDCTGNDAYMIELRSRFGRNAVWSNSARPGVYGNGSTFLYNTYDHADANAAVTPGITPTKTNVLDIFGNAVGGILGDLAQAKKDGEVLPKALDTVAGLVIKTEKAAVDAAQKSAEKEIGATALKNSPYILGAVAVILGLLVYFMFKK